MYGGYFAQWLMMDPFGLKSLIKYYSRGKGGAYKNYPAIEYLFQKVTVTLDASECKSKNGESELSWQDGPYECPAEDRYKTNTQACTGKVKVSIKIENTVGFYFRAIMINLLPTSEIYIPGVNPDKEHTPVVDMTPKKTSIKGKTYTAEVKNAFSIDCDGGKIKKDIYFTIKGGTIKMGNAEKISLDLSSDNCGKNLGINFDLSFIGKTKTTNGVIHYTGDRQNRWIRELTGPNDPNRPSNTRPARPAR